MSFYTWCNCTVKPHTYVACLPLWHRCALPMFVGEPLILVCATTVVRLSVQGLLACSMLRNQLSSMFDTYQSTITWLKIINHMIEESPIEWLKIEDWWYGQGCDHDALNSRRFGVILLVKLTVSVSYTKMVLATMLTQRRLVCQGLISKSWHTLD
jgi:hypothetical protein